MKKIILGLMLSSIVTLNTYASETMYCIGNNVCVRAEPYIGSEVYGYARRNTTFECLEKVNDYYLISTCDGKAAYVSAQYLSDSECQTPTVDENELYLMAHLLAGECQPYPDEEQLLVGSVALNRVRSSKFPNNLRDVIFQKGQYACTWDGNFDRTPTERNWNNARTLLESGSILPEYVVFQSKSRVGKHEYMRTKYHVYSY